MKYNLIKWFSLLSSILLILPVFANPPPNDDLASALKIVLPYSNTQNTFEASLEESETFPFSCTYSQASVWYQYTPTTDENVVFDTFGSDYDTVLGIWNGDEHPLTEIACNDNSTFSTLQSQVNTTLTKDTKYFISVNGFNNETGTLMFHGKTLEESLGNDDLSQAINISDKLPYTDTLKTNTASNEAQEVLSSCTTNSSDSVWYQYTPDTETTVMLDTLDSNYDTVLSVWTGSQHPLTELACNDDIDGERVQSQVKLTLSPDTTYYISISKLNDTEQGETNILVLNAKSSEDSTGILGIAINAKGKFINTKAYFKNLVITENGLYGNDLNIAQNDETTLSATIQVDIRHVGKTADILMVAVLHLDIPIFFMRGADYLSWEPWYGDIASLNAAEEGVELPESLQRIIYQGPLAGLPLVPYTVYIGYRLANGNIIFNGTKPIGFQIQ